MISVISITWSAVRADSRCHKVFLDAPDEGEECAPECLLVLLSAAELQRAECHVLRTLQSAPIPNAEIIELLKNCSLRVRLEVIHNFPASMLCHPEPHFLLLHISSLRYAKFVLRFTVD